MYARSRGEPKKKKKHAKKKRKQYSSSDSEASEDDPVDAKQHAADHVALILPILAKSVYENNLARYKGEVVYKCNHYNSITNTSNPSLTLVVIFGMFSLIKFSPKL